MRGDLFRFDPARMAIQMAAGMWLVGLTVYAVPRATGRLGAVNRFSLVGLAIVGCQGTLSGGLFYLIQRRAGVRVGPAGLTPEAPLHVGRLVRWEQIAAVRPRQLGLVPVLRLRGPGVRLNLPLPLADPDGFAAAVGEFAGPDHPLTRALHDLPGRADD